MDKDRRPPFTLGTWRMVCVAVSTLLLTGCGGSGSSGSVPPVVSGGASGNSSGGSAGSASGDSTGNASGYSSFISADNPAAFYQLSDSGATMADAGPNGLTGTYGSAVVHNVASLTAEAKTAAGFPGGSYANAAMAVVPPRALLNPAGAVTVEAWIVESTLNESHTDLPIVAYGVSPGYSYELTVSDQNQLRFRVHTLGPATYYSASGATPLQPGKAYHVVGTYDGGTLSVYLDGVLDASVPATGAMRTFPAVPASGGLAVGGALNTATPLFAGDLQDVAIYARALSAKNIAQHYAAGLATPLLSETPSQADAFVDSIGINTHFHYQGGSYVTQFGAIKSLLVASGIRHIREGLYAPTWLGYFAQLDDLASSGIHSSLVADLSLSQTDIATLPTKYYQNSMEAFEGPNEPDLNGGPNWVTATRAFQQQLYATLKANPATAQYPVYAPSVTSVAAAGQLGNLSAYLDYGNIHGYYESNPGSTGYGSITPWGYDGTVSYFKNYVSQISGTKPIVSTETGYGTQASVPGSVAVSRLADGKYTPRLYFEQFNNAIYRTYIYEFIDEGPKFNHNGLLDATLAPKPAYTSVKGLISLLSDKGAPFTPTPLKYTLAGDITNLAHTLLEKRDGTYCLALWLEVPSWNMLTMTDINVPAQSVQVRLPFTPTSASVATLDDLGNLSTSALGGTGGVVTVPVADRITVLTFHP